MPTLSLSSSPRRLTAAFVALAVVFGVFGIRLVWLQGLESSRYANMAANERLRVITLPSQRGSILDTNGVPLATTVDAVDLIVDQTQISNPAAAALQMAEPLGRDPADLQAAMTGDDPYVPLQRTVDGPVWSSIRAMGIKGIYSEPSADRAYPAGTVAGSVVGFTGGNGKKGDLHRVIGLAGLEKAYEDLLAGAEGSLRYERDSAGRAIPLADQARVDPVPGSGLQLTIDRDIQWYVEQALAAKVAESRAASGAAAVLDPATGAILALADVPLVDPNDPGDKPKKDRGSRAIRDPFEPGSVQKVLTMACLIESGAATPDEVFLVPDEVPRADRTIGDFHPHEDWRITLSGILAKSSNVGTMLAAERIDKGDLRDCLVEFGYGQKPGLGLPSETAGLLPKNWTDLQRDTISFGQTVATTVLHLASAYGAIANDGLRMPPYLVESIIDPDGTTHPVPLAESNRVVKPSTAEQVTTMMEGVLAPGGTASNIVLDGYRLAGKTGTAERLDTSCGCYNGYTATFAGFAPADDPSLVAVVAIQDPKRGRYGGQLAGPVFTDIMRFALPRLGIAPSGTKPPTIQIFAD